MRTAKLLAFAAFSVSTGSLTACVDTFEGSNVQIEFASTFPPQASSYGTAEPGAWEPNSHFELYAVEDFDQSGDGTMVAQRIFKVQEFEVHRIVDLASPCFIDVGPHVPHPGLHVSQFAAQIEADTGITDIANPGSATEDQKIEMATALQRQSNVDALAGDMGIKVVTSASQSTYPAEAADCNGGDDMIPPPTCTDAASNKRRLDQCQAAWSQDADLFEGTDRVLTEPLNGQTNGFVDGLNPVNLAPVGGAQFFVSSALAGFEHYALYHIVDNATEPGDLVLYGDVTMPTRGVEHVHMTSPVSPALAAELAIFVNLGDDDVHF
jgi:hypothetical protein